MQIDLAVNMPMLIKAHNNCLKF